MSCGGNSWPCWVPAAREMLGSPITRISSGSYSCRNRYGLANAAISEHAFANAIDISSFTTADGRTVNVLKHWGATERDIEAQRVAEAKAKAAAKANRAVVLPYGVPDTLAMWGDTEYSAVSRP